MNGFDVVVVLSLLSAVVGGYRVGLLTRASSWVGLTLGLLLAAQNMAAILRVAGDPQEGARTALLAGVLFGCALLGKALGFLFGTWVHRSLPGRPLRTADRVGGGVLGAAGVVAVVWLVVPLLAAVPGWPAEQSRRSAVARLVADNLPAPPDELGALRHLLEGAGFPQVLDRLRPSPAAGPPPEAVALDPGIEARVRGAVVRVQADACRVLESGTGFFVSPHEVLTNAHVVAGSDRIRVLDAAGSTRGATLTAFDGNADLALLRVDGAAADPLTFAPANVDDEVAVFGHRGGGPLRVAPGVVHERVDAVGRDLWDRRESRREVLVLAADLGPGDSGSPVVRPDGRVAGVAFAIAPDRATTAYALTDAEAEAFLEDRPAADAGPCLSG